MEERITAMVRGAMNRQDDDLAIDPDTDLWAAGMSSMDTVGLVIAIEDEFGIEFPDEVVTRAAFTTVRAIARTVSEQLAARQGMVG